MKSLPLLFTALALAGCATPFRAPAGAAHIRLERVDSAAVAVEKVWLEQRDGRLAVAGSVVRQPGHDDTSRTHLDVTLFDARGTTVWSATGVFAPQQVEASTPRRHRDATYRIVLDHPPAAIARLEVRAHDGPH